eukprot:CAMPEP_0175790310 /NCGR_PEP_ID=MMETSP0097-20121207/81849_1 /TAXON_ID=311494 /ORGANISM="Alexandrium monilatum, Strain CCMP3105" /LENGTH=336 /DNA_ID=CAMNT_0017101391 /DNA_START=340 /DNA_END=1348 /DNA_ORIENTATION=-
MHTLVPSEASLLLAGDLVSRPLAERMRDVAAQAELDLRPQAARIVRGGGRRRSVRLQDPGACAPPGGARTRGSTAAACRASLGAPGATSAARRAARGRRSGRAAGVGTASNSRPARVVALESSGMVLVTSSGVLVAAASQTTWGTAGAGGGTRDVVAQRRGAGPASAKMRQRNAEERALHLPRCAVMACCGGLEDDTRCPCGLASHGLAPAAAHGAAHQQHSKAAEALPASASAEAPGCQGAARLSEGGGSAANLLKRQTGAARDVGLDEDNGLGPQVNAVHACHVRNVTTPTAKRQVRNDGEPAALARSRALGRLGAQLAMARNPQREHALPTLL